MFEIIKKELRLSKEKPSENVIIMIGRLCDILGIALPTDQTAIVTTKYIQSEFNKFTLNEFIIAGKLHNKQIISGFEHFNKLSPAFLEKLMAAYGKYTYDIRINTNKMLAEKNELSQQEKNQIMINSLTGLIQQTKKQESNITYTPTMFMWLESIGIIDLTNDVKQQRYNNEKDKLKEHYMNKSIHNKRYRSYLRDWEKHINEEQTIVKIKNNARRESLRIFIDDCIEMDRDIINEIRELC